MSNLIRATTCLTVGLLVAACASASSSSGPSQSPATSSSVAAAASPSGAGVTAAPLASNAPSVVPSVPSATKFTSRTYGYSLLVPGGWSAIQASKVWDGTGAPSHDAPEADQFVGPASGGSWAFAAPTTKDLAGYAKQWVDATATFHGDTCTAPPESMEPITIAGQSGMLLSFNCGILISSAVTVHHGIGYQFGFRDPGVHAATDPVDRVLLLELVGSVRFPG